MVQISKKPVNKEILSHIEKLVFQILGKNSNYSEFNLIFKTVFTKAEYIMLSKRVAAYYLFIKGFSQGHVQEILCLSYSTVSRLESTINSTNPLIITKFKKIVMRENVSKIFDDLIDALYMEPGRLRADWKTAWQKKFYKQRQKERGI